MTTPKNIYGDVLDMFFDDVDFDIDLKKLNKEELVKEYCLLKKGCLELIEEHIEKVLELDRKTKKPNTSGFLKDLNLKEWDSVTIFRLAILRVNRYPDKPKTIEYYDELDTENPGDHIGVAYPGKMCRHIPNPLNADVIAERHNYPIDRPKPPYMDSLKEAIGQVIAEKLGRQLTAAEHDRMTYSYLDDGKIGQIMRKIFFKDQAN